MRAFIGLAILILTNCAGGSEGPKIGASSPQKNNGTGSGTNSGSLGGSTGTPTGGADGTPFDPGSALELPDKLLNAKYNLTVSALIPICVGQISVSINKDFTLSPVQGTAACGPFGACQIDIGKLLATMGPGISQNLKVSPQMFDLSDKRVIRVKELLGVRYAPSRPLMPSPLALKPADLASINENAPVTATYQGQSYQGQMGLAVSAVDQPYSHPLLGVPFEKTFTWQLTSTGFDGIDRMKTGILPKLTMVWGIKPFGIPAITVVGKTRELMQTPNGNMANASLTELAKFCGGASGEFIQAVAPLGEQMMNNGGLLGSLMEIGKKFAMESDAKVELILQSME